MAYQVSLSAPAEADAYAAFDRIREAAPRHAEKWLIGLFAAILSLEEIPARCPLIPEAKELGFPAQQLYCVSGTAPAMPSLLTTCSCDPMPGFLETADPFRV